MFTGIIEEIGRIQSLTPSGASVRLFVNCSEILPGMRIGDSIAVDGVCLTAESVEKNGFSAFASPETLKKTSLGERLGGDGVNLERALSMGSRLGGHMVSGHVDTTGHFKSARTVDNAYEVRIAAPREILQQSIPKGSITVDGISLTIVDLTDDDFSLWIIPETWKKTTLSQRKAGQKVNLESDLIGKYIYRFMETRAGSRDAAIEDLLKKGGWGER